MKTNKKTALTLSGLFTVAILAAMPTPASAANLASYYPVDSYFYSGGVPYTPNTAPGSTWAANASLQYSGGVLYQNTIDPNGKVNAAYLEQGTQARLVFGSVDPFAATGSFTYAAWVYTPSTFTGGAQTFILSKFSANTALGLYFKLMLRPTDIQFMTWNGSAVQTINSPALTGLAGNWNHIAITGTKVGTATTWNLYQNGNLITTTPIASTINSTATAVSMNIGMAAGGQQFGFNGVKYDEIRFYDGILSQSEILDIIAVPEPGTLTLGLLCSIMFFARRSQFLS